MPSAFAGLARGRVDGALYGLGELELLGHGVLPSAGAEDVAVARGELAPAVERAGLDEGLPVGCWTMA
jgi:hypothetical protein